jgi:hypothetical protein
MKTFKMTLLLSLFLITNGILVSQTLINNSENGANKGTIDNNRGIIKFKTTGALQDLPDFIGGTVIYQSPYGGTEQTVPNITYFKLIFDSRA